MKEFFVDLGLEKVRCVGPEELDLEKFQKELRDYGASSIEGVIFLLESYDLHVFRGRDRRELPTAILF
jgi:hypothetical protein